MKTVSVIQLGDIHYPDEIDAIHADYKDTSIDPAFVRRVAPPKLQSVVRAVQEICTSHQADGILICGDLTSRGDLASYGQCVAYLKQCLNLGTAAWPLEVVHVVPGNHDINQDACDPTGNDIFLKFAPLRDDWNRNGFPILDPEHVRATDLIRDKCAVRVFSLNSCIGCRERRHLPQRIAAQFRQMLDDYKIANGDNSFDLIGEQLDTPAFAQEHLEAILSAVRSLPDSSVPLVLAHHNLLPQATLRVDLYTEMLNGGTGRSRLSSATRRIVYCHGHIHSDPIELITTPNAPNGGLLSISAPMLSDGFNLLEFFFSTNCIPVGVSISHYVASPDGAVERRSPVRIPLVSSSDASFHGTDNMKGAFQATTTDWERFGVILARVRAADAVKHREAHVSDALLEAEWFSLIEIRDRAKPAQHWTIRRLHP